MLLGVVVPGVIPGALPCVLWISRRGAALKKTLTPKYLSGAEGLMAPSRYKIDLLQNPTSNSYQKWWFVMRSRFTDLQL